MVLQLHRECHISPCTSDNYLKIEQHRGRSCTNVASQARAFCLLTRSLGPTTAETSQRAAATALEADPWPAKRAREEEGGPGPLSGSRSLTVSGGRIRCEPARRGGRISRRAWIKRGCF